MGFDTDVFDGPKKSYDSSIFDDNSGSAKIFTPVNIGKDAFPAALRETLRGTDWGTRNIAGAGTALSNAWEGLKQFAGMDDKSRVAANNVIREEAPVGAFTGDAALLAGPLGLTGNSLKAAGGVSALYSGLQPIDSSNPTDIAKGKLFNAALGGVTGVTGQALSNKLMSGPLSGKIASIEQKVADKAAEVAAKETASARSAAGNAAQDAYRQLEHIRELGKYRQLTPEEAMIAHKLELELGDKAVEKLIPSVAKKEATSDAYKEAMKTEAQRAADYAAEKLSGKEAKDQFMARLKRYGPAALGGALGHMMMPGVGTLGGAAGGLYLRPAIRSMVNLAQNPAVQHGLLSAADSSLKFSGPFVPTASVLGGYGLLGQ